MPPRKNKSKQAKLKVIQTRLMEISIKMDNYIYKHRPIALQDAKLYIQQISSYKSQCGDNARISQVIEKLNRQLKAVIDEERGSPNHYNVEEVIENSIPTGIVSPTYSINDDTRELQHAVSNVNEVDININNMVLENNFIGIDEHADIIDLCSDENIDEALVTGNEKSVSSNIKDIQRSLSQLSIHLVNEKQKDLQNGLPKQVKNVPQLTITEGKIFQDNNNLLKNKVILQINTDKVTSSDRTCQDMMETVHNNLIANNNSAPEISYNVLLDPIATNKSEDKITQSQPKKKRSINKNKKKDTMAMSVKEIPKKRHNKKSETQLSTETTNSTDLIINDIKIVHPKFPTSNIFIEQPDNLKNIDPPKHKKKILKSQLTDENNKKTDLPLNHNNKTVHPPCSKNILIKPTEVLHADSIKAIYNKNVENDLSWIENIRYVREVAPDEIDPTLTYLDDTFWDTFDLPTNWNDQDFLY